ncbi:hypothetical protein HK104_007431 [Borealophlyctis nickersoniae]|nr:hypothetical protein HK104_007431 [Borealophlyctis nickersoniae]
MALLDLTADPKAEPSKYAQHYLTLLDAAGSQLPGIKQQAASYIPQYFSYFPEHHGLAIDRQFDLCEDDDPKIREEAIKRLPFLCVKGELYDFKIADVLCQLLQSESNEELMVVKTALNTMFTKHSSKTLEAIFHHLAESSSNQKLQSLLVDFLSAAASNSALEPETDEAIATHIVDLLENGNEVSQDIYLALVGVLQRLASSKKIKFAESIVNINVNRITHDASDVMSFPLHGFSENKHSKMLIHRQSSKSEELQRLADVVQECVPFLKNGAPATKILTFIQDRLMNWKEFMSYSPDQQVQLLRAIADVQRYPADTAVQSGMFSSIKALFMEFSPGKGGQALKCSHMEPILFVLYSYVLKNPSSVEDDGVIKQRLQDLYPVIMRIKARFSQDFLAARNKPALPENEAEKAKADRKLNLANNLYELTRVLMLPGNSRTPVSLRLSWHPEPPKPQLKRKAPETTGAAPTGKTAGSPAKKSKPTVAGAKLSRSQKQQEAQKQKQLHQGAVPDPKTLQNASQQQQRLQQQPKTRPAAQPQVQKQRGQPPQSASGPTRRSSTVRIVRNQPYLPPARRTATTASTVVAAAAQPATTQQTVRPAASAQPLRKVATVQEGGRNGVAIAGRGGAGQVNSGRGKANTGQGSAPGGLSRRFGGAKGRK